MKGAMVKQEVTKCIMTLHRIYTILYHVVSTMLMLQLGVFFKQIAFTPHQPNSSIAATAMSAYVSRGASFLTS